MKDYGNYIRLDCPECGIGQSRSHEYHAKRGTDLCENCERFNAFFDEVISKLTLEERIKRIEKWVFLFKQKPPLSEIYFKGK